jgi:hypothetical protein
MHPVIFFSSSILFPNTENNIINVQYSYPLSIQRFGHQAFIKDVSVTKSHYALFLNV